MNDFPAFIAEISQSLDQGDSQRLRGLLLQWAASSDAGAEVHAFLDQILRPYRLFLDILQDGKTLEHVTLEPDGTEYPVAGIIPGRYEIVSRTGQLLWDRELTEIHVLWTHAFPNRPLDLAASTEAGEPIHSLVEHAHQNVLRIAVSPGLTQGELILTNCRFQS